jgi:serine/threonine protein kinase
MASSGTRIGSEIAGFLIESVLGRGGMSVVYLAQQTRLGRKVALKVMASGLLERDEDFRDRFLQESHLAAGLDHPNIIPIYDAGEAEGFLYIAMRYVEGQDLAQVLESEGPLGLGRTLFVLNQVASALDAAHEYGLVHRDVKPANVLLVGNTDRVYLTDFGVAKPSTSGGLTRTGFFIGTPDYSAPEQIEGRPVDARTDVYALGAVLYSALTALTPYERATEVAVLQAHLLEPPPKVRDRRPELPRALDRVIARAMAKSMDDRYPTCGDLMAAAEAAAHERPLTGPVEATLISSQSRDAPAAPGPSESDPAASAVVPAASPPEPAAGTPPAADPPQAADPPAQASASDIGAPTPAPGEAPPGHVSPAEAVPVGAPPASPGPAPSRWRSGLLVGILAGAVVGLGVALAVVLLTRSDSGSTGGGSATQGTSLHAALSSSAEVPASISSTSSGTADVTIDGTKVCWKFQLDGVDSPTAAHIHQGGSSVSGPVVVPLGSAYKQSGCTTAQAGVTAAVLRDPGSYYVNVHSQTYPDGAVRGQLVAAGSAPAAGAEHVVGLAGIVPKPILRGCTVAVRPKPGAVQTAECVPPVTGQVSSYPDHLELSTFANGNALVKAYNAARKHANLGANFGRCDGAAWTGEGRWLHTPAVPGQPGKPGGRRFCYFDGNVAVMVWMHEKFGQPTHVDFLGIARENGSDHAGLFNWWRFWTHRIGLCELPDCTASAR